MKKIFLTNESCSDFPDDYRFNGIDIVKFICAFLVCIIHIQPFKVGLIGIDNLKYVNFGLQQYLCRVAVPFYFTASGFLLYRKIDFSKFDWDRVKNYCFKLLRLLGTWTLLLKVGGKGQLWYLGSLVVAALLISILIKKGMSLRYIIILSFVFYGIGLLGDSYNGFLLPLEKYHLINIIIRGYKMIFATTRNGIFFGLIFISIGAFFAKKRVVINNKIAILGLITSLIIMFIETFLLKHYSRPRDFNMVLSLIPVIFFLFYLASHIKLKNRPIYKRLQIIGMLVFFTHLLFNFFVVLIIKLLYRKLGIDLSIYQFVLTIISTTTFAIIIERLSNKNRFKWLKYLYS